MYFNFGDKYMGSSPVTYPQKRDEIAQNIISSLFIAALSLSLSLKSSTAAFLNSALL